MKNMKECKPVFQLGRLQDGFIILIPFLFFISNLMAVIKINTLFPALNLFPLAGLLCCIYRNLLCRWSYKNNLELSKLGSEHWTDFLTATNFICDMLLSSIRKPWGKKCLMTQKKDTTKMLNVSQWEGKRGQTFKVIREEDGEFLWLKYVSTFTEINLEWIKSFSMN